MTSKRTIAIVAALSIPILALLSTQTLAYAHGHGKSRHLFLLARAAGITREQIVTAFKADANLKTLHANKKTSGDALVNCLVSGGNCSSQIAAYAAAQQALTQEKLTVWQGLFQKAPNDKQAATVLGELRQLQTQRMDILQQIFGAPGGGGM